MPSPASTTAIFPIKKAAEKPNAVMEISVVNIMTILIFSLRERL